MEVLWKSTVSAEFLANRLKNHLSAKFSHQEISCNNILGSGDIHIRMNILDKKWKSYIQTECSTSGKMYGLVKLIKTTIQHESLRVVVTLLLSPYPYLWKRYYMI